MGSNFFVPFNLDEPGSIKHDIENKDDIIKFYGVKTCNILIVGATGTGKTTFLNSLKDPRYNAVSNLSSQTKEANMENLLFSINDEYFAATIIDTPGFGDNTGKSNFEMEELILKFVKRGIVSLNLVLITLRYGVRLEQSQIDTIMSVLRFLGKDLKPNCAILFTHTEKKTKEERQLWYDQIAGITRNNKGEITNNKDKTGNFIFEKTPLTPVVKFCMLEPFYTGMNTENRAIDVENYVKDMRVNHTKLLKKACDIIPMKLNGDDGGVTNQFKLYESAAKDSLTIKKLLPLLQELAGKVVILKSQISEFKDSDEAGDILETYKDIDITILGKQIIEWSKLQTAISDYIEKGDRVSKCAEEIRRQFGFLNEAIIKMQLLLDQLNLGI